MKLRNILAATIGFALGIILEEIVTTSCYFDGDFYSSLFFSSEGAPAVLRETAHADDALPHMSGLANFVEEGCVTSAIDEYENRNGEGWRSTFDASTKSAEWCESKAGDGTWTPDGTWEFTYAKECGFHWFPPEEICSLLSGRGVFFFGDSTSRRMTFTLRAALSGLVVANENRACDPDDTKCPQMIPDASKKYTDDISRCLPATRCPSVSIAGALLLTTELHRDGTYRATRKQFNNTGKNFEYKSFPYIPFVHDKVNGPEVSVPQMASWRKALRRMHLMIKRMQKTYPSKNSIVVANIGAWLLQSSEHKMFTPRDQLQTIKESDLSRDVAVTYRTKFYTKKKKKYAIEDMNNAYYLADIVQSSLLRAHTEKQKNAIWVWRDAYPILPTHRRFAPESDEEYASFNETRRRMTKNRNRFYVGDYNEAIRDFNNYVGSALSESDIIVGNTFDAILPSSSGFSPAIDSYSGIHVNDLARKVALQIILNEVALRITAEGA